MKFDDNELSNSIVQLKMIELMVGSQLNMESEKGKQLESLKKIEELKDGEIEVYSNYQTIIRNGIAIGAYDEENMPVARKTLELINEIKKCIEIAYGSMKISIEYGDDEENKKEEKIRIKNVN